MGKRVFISHSSLDEKIVSLFVDHILDAGSGVSLEDIVYTTRPDTGINNGENMPTAIIDGIKTCDLFIMMVSDNYRKSEVCLNEMGAALMRDNLPIIILLLPNIGFDKIGWLLSLNKGTNITESEGLDQIHDQISKVLSSNSKTATWNRHKLLFLEYVHDLNKQINVDMNCTNAIVEHENDGELDILDMREGFDVHTKAYTEILHLFTQTMNSYSEKLAKTNKKLTLLRSNPYSLTPTQLRSVFLSCAQGADDVSLMYEQKTSEFRFHFEKSIEFALLLQKTSENEEVRKDNKRQFKDFVDTMVSTRDELRVFRSTLDDGVDLDKHFKNSKERLKVAMDNMLEVISFCISRASFLL